MSPRARPHRLAALMEELGVSDRQLAAILQPDPRKRENERTQIVKRRKAQRIMPATAD